MIPENIKDLIAKLKEKTKNNNAKWQTSSGENEFQIKLDAGKIVIDSFHNEHDNEWYVSFGIYNKEGNEVIRNTVEQSDISGDYELLLDFHETVQNSYLKTDETINKMIFEINGKDEVGEIDSPLPF
jgi:subtilase family serine protease